MTITKEIAELFNIKEGTELEVEAMGGWIVSGSR